MHLGWICRRSLPPLKNRIAGFRFGSKAVQTAPQRDFRSTPINGHRWTAKVRLVPEAIRARLGGVQHDLACAGRGQGDQELGCVFLDCLCTRLQRGDLYGLQP